MLKIVTSVVNNPIFIEIQYYTLKKYFQGEYEFIVFNDAKGFPDLTNDGDITIRKQIEDICKKLDIKCINISNEHHKINSVAYSEAAADAMTFILNYQKQNPDKYLLLDSDMFLIDYFDINKYAKYDCAVVLQSSNNFKTNYVWNGIYYFDIIKMKNLDLLNWSCCPGCDTGGETKEWLKKQMENIPIPNTDEIRWTNKKFHTGNTYFIKHLWSCSWNMTELPVNLKENKKIIEFLQNDPRNKNNKFFCEIYDDVFLHYRAGGNWQREGIELHKQLSEKLKNTLL